MGSQLNFNKNITKELPEKQTSLSNFGFTQQKSQSQPQQQQKIFPIIQNFENNKTQNKIIPQQPTITKVDIVNHKNSSNVSSNVSSLSKINQSNNEIFIDDPVDEKEKEQDYMNNIVYLPTISNIKGKEVNRSFRVSLQPDYQNCETFIYPHVDEYPVRKYQRTIIERSFHYNTLVVLPTGLGKTFIAAVVMKNYLRWFPQGKIIFLAPTRPLVTQQIEACHDISGISEEITAELMGSVKPSNRSILWKEKRVFYCTPQTALSDIKSKILPMNDIVLIVIDEAHRATGNYDYVQVIQKLSQNSPDFRILALSATPGKDFEKVQEVVHNLLISRIEYKSEADLDVREYI